MTLPSVTRGLVGLLVAAACTSPPALPSPGVSSVVPPSTTPSGAVSTSIDPSSSPSATAQPTPVPITTINADTEMGTLTLEIPTPLIVAGTDITVELRPQEEAPRDVRDAGARQPFHVLLPQDLIFAEPVRVTLTMPTERVTRDDGSIAIAYLAIRSPDGVWQWLDEARMTITRQTTQISGTATHLGSLFAWSDRTDLVVPRDPPPQAVGSTVRPQVSLSSQDQRPHPVVFTQAPDYFSMVPTVVEVGPPELGTDTRDLRCLAEGDYTVRLTGRLTNFGADNPFFTTTLRLPPTTGTLSYDLTGSCVIPVPATPTPAATPTAAPSTAAPSPSQSAEGSPSPSASGSPSNTGSPAGSPNETPNSSPSSSP